MSKHLLFTFLISTLWSQAQVSLVKDINPVGDGMPFYPLNRIELNSQLIFAANNDSEGMELWTSDGTEVGTTLLFDVRSGGLSSEPAGFHLFNNAIYFSAAGIQNKRNIFSTDGNVLSSYPQIRAGTGSASPRLLTTYGNLLVFSARPSVQNQSTPFFGEEILGFDGTPWIGGGDQIMIKDINPGLNSSSPDNYTEINGMLYFAATEASGRELWVTDGTNAGTNLLLDINSGSDSSNPNELIVFNNKIYFSADDGVNGRELWVTDGTVAGTQLVQDLFPGGSGNPTGLTVYNNFLIFTANNPTTGIEAFKMTATENITLLQNINPGSGSSSPFGYTVFNGELYFAADNGSGVELWKSGGFPSNTTLLADINPFGESTPQGFTAYNGKLYFNADDGTRGRELWVTDGTTAGTQIVEDIWTGVASSDPIDLVVANDLLFFSANDGSTGYELFKYQDPTLSVNNELLSDAMSLFPNPTNSSFTINMNETITNLSIYNIHGQVVKTFLGIQNNYNIEDLTSGVYFITIKTETGSLTKKLIKE